MVQLTGDFFTSLEVIALCFLPGAQAVPADPVHATSGCRIRRVVMYQASPPLAGFLHAAPGARAISVVNVIPYPDHVKRNEAELAAWQNGRTDTDSGQSGAL